MDGDNWIWRVTATQVEPYTTDVTQFLLAGKLEAQAVEVGKDQCHSPRMNMSSSSLDRWTWATL
jgi:hypothetical protein